MLADLLNRYDGIGAYLGRDLVAIFLMTYVLYFRRCWCANRRHGNEVRHGG